MKQTPANLGIDQDPVRHPEGCRPGMDCDTWLIENATLINPNDDKPRNGSVLLADGKIQAVGEINDHDCAAVPPEHRLDAEGLWLMPGIVDSWARLREPGLEHKANIATESAAAVCGGITTLCMPPDTDPILDTVAVARFIKRRAQLAGRARVVCIGAMTQQLDGELLSEMAALAEGGCVAISNAQTPFANLNLLRRALAYAATFDLQLVLEPTDPSLSARGCAHEGMVATRLGLPGIPVSAETAPLAQLIALLQEVDARVHINQVSSAAAVDMLRHAQNQGLKITAGVSIHHLWLTDMDTDALNPNTHVIPPLRTERDRAALRQGLADGVLSVIISDHQPHE
ncbi:MAG TPA: dihydroorotase, partial [Halothiobacillaceae bacterium]|nr:dihydroorotase [Halothiobacillaceae bacterium]